jgi:RNA polymerase sigma factor (sigma-70 family)
MNAVKAVAEMEDAHGAPIPDFDTFVSARWAAWHRLAYLITRNNEDAADAVQNALMGLFPRWEKVAAGGNPEAYVRRSIANAHVSSWRKTSRTAPSDNMEIWAPAVADRSEAVANSAFAMELCDKLPERQRRAVILRFYEDLSYEQIAEITGGNAAAARALVSHALKSMRSQLSERGERA